MPYLTSRSGERGIHKKAQPYLVRVLQSAVASGLTVQLLSRRVYAAKPSPTASAVYHCQGFFPPELSRL